MATKIIKADKFNTRQDLENEVRNLFGLTTERKDARIEGTEEDLAHLRLANGSMFWGIPCVDRDAKPPEPPREKVHRGEQRNFGINGNLKNPNV